MLIRHSGVAPRVDPSAYVAPTAALVGAVTVGPRARVMYGAVLDAEGSRVEIGECTIVCEHAVLRATAVGDEDHPVLLGDHAFVGPHATLLGCSVQSAAYVATGGTVLHGAALGSGAVVAVGALAHGGTRLPDGFFLPPGTIAIGDPPRTYAPSPDAELARGIRQAGFAARAFGVTTAWEDRATRYREVTEVRSREFAAHVDDEIIGDAAGTAPR
jgi:carbonic anhydrase/acetyltransferase-like protein (isoleucine patch superfamily)